MKEKLKSINLSQKENSIIPENIHGDPIYQKKLWGTLILRSDEQ